MGQETSTLEELKTCEGATRESEAKPDEEQKCGETPAASEHSEAEAKPDPGTEMRRAPRLQCSGLAGIQTLPVCEKPCPARIVDLSVGGCLMEAERPLTLAVDEIVELIFCVNHMPFRVRGRVRVLRSDREIGFQFPQLSDRIRRQIEDLIGELIEHLKKLHQESIAAHRSSEDGSSQDRRPSAPPLPGVLNRQFTKAAPGPHGTAVRQPEPNRRWF